jgi:hypothetical protein
MANFPPLFITAAGGHERLTPADGGLQIDIIDCAAANSAVQLFNTVNNTGSVSILTSCNAAVTIGASGGVFNFVGGIHVAEGATIHTSAIIADNTLTLGTADVNKYIDANQGLANTPSIRYDSVANRWGFTDDGITWTTFAAIVSSWDEIYAVDKTLDINDIGLVWTQTGSNKGVALTVSRTLAAGDTNGALVHFSSTGDQSVVAITNATDAMYALDTALSPAAATAKGLIVRTTAAHTASNPGFEVYNDTTTTTVWQACLNGDQAMAGNLTLTAGGQVNTTANGILQLLPNGTGITVVGTDTVPSFLAASQNNLMVSNDIEINGVTYATGGISSMYAVLRGVADNGFYLGIDPTNGQANNNFVLVPYAGVASDYAHNTPSTNPTLIVHSNTLAGVATNEWISRCFDVADGVDSTGKGGHVLAPYNGSVYFGVAAAAIAKNFAIKTFHQTVTLNAGTDATLVGLVPNGVVIGAAIRVSTQITGLSNDIHTISLGIVGTTTKYCTATQAGPAATTIDVNTKAHYTGLATTAETVALQLTIGVGADVWPTAGAVEVEIHYFCQAALPNV